VDSAYSIGLFEQCILYQNINNYASKVTFIHFLCEWRIACSFYAKAGWTDVKFLHGSVLKNESEPNFGFPHIPNGMLMWSVCVAARQCKWSAAGNWRCSPRTWHSWCTACHSLPSSPHHWGSLSVFFIIICALICIQIWGPIFEASWDFPVFIVNKFFMRYS